MSEPTAQEDYDKTKDEVWWQVKKVQDFLKYHHKAFDGKNWGMVGDLKRISELLRQILEEDS